MIKLKKITTVLAVAGLALPGIAAATDGYFSHGYGMKAKGMGGAATAMADDAMGGANNPASMVFAGDRLDVGIDWFRPIRTAERSGSGGGFGPNGKADSGHNNFFIPEFGYNKLLNQNMSLGVTVYGNGGMNTEYPGGQTSPASCTGGANPSIAKTQNLLCGKADPGLGMNLQQLIIAPTLAYKVNQNNSFGISPLFGYQKFKAEGLNAFSGISSSPANLTDQGDDTASGWGVRVGWMGKVSNSVTLGAAYSSKISMSKFDRYKGLFADQGSFDIPENWSLGIAVQATPKVLLAADYQRINYGGIKAINDPSTQAGCTPNQPFGPGAGTACLGGSNGIGFGWGNVDVFKLGVEYKYTDKTTLRAGYNRTQNPIQSRDVTFNIIAPGIVQDMYTLGFTYALDNASEITMSYMHAAENSVSGSPNTAYFPVGGTDTIKMYQDSLGIAYGKHF
ncbi:MAG: outer membrane protein transport protein [Sulfuricellaceae bacterium]|nr:outer membrane protein transport protein [Sulfuricellaceae bacterium]